MNSDYVVCSCCNIRLYPSPKVWLHKVIVIQGQAREGRYIISTQSRKTTSVLSGLYLLTKVVLHHSPTIMIVSIKLNPQNREKKHQYWITNICTIHSYGAHLYMCRIRLRHIYVLILTHCVLTFTVLFVVALVGGVAMATQVYNPYVLCWMFSADHLITGQVQY